MEAEVQKIKPASWLDEALQLPLYFAIVREDPLLDVAVANELPDQARGIMIASGGCTAAMLAATGRFAHLQLVDANRGQIALAQLKLHLLAQTTPTDRLAILGHTAMSADVRLTKLKSILAELSLGADLLGPEQLLGELGPDHLGRYEVLFAQLRRQLVGHRDSIAKLFACTCLAEQVSMSAPDTELGAAIDTAFQDVMSLDNLVALFGAGATQNRIQPFADHFLARTRATLATLPARTNPYLASVLLGHFYDGNLLPWLSMTPRMPMPVITASVSPMDDVLSCHKSDYDFVHLSNILDWLSVEEAQALLTAASSALRPGGKVLIRQLNSSLDIASLSQDFVWLTDKARQLHKGDRSYFYRAIYLGEKK